MSTQAKELSLPVNSSKGQVEIMSNTERDSSNLIVRDRHGYFFRAESAVIFGNWLSAVVWSAPCKTFEEACHAVRP